MELIGKSTINPFVFYTGKISGYITWIVLILSLCCIESVNRIEFYRNDIIAYFIFSIGIVFIIVSLVNLGKSTRLGLPSDSTKLKTNGIYQLSRNPMFVGFNLFTIASMIYTMNILIGILGIYSLIVYHLIIKSEELFLIERFDSDYENYTKKVRRYL